MSLGGGSARVLLGFLLACFSRCARVLREKAHGMPFGAIPLAPSHAVWSEKGSRGADVRRKRKVGGVTSAKQRCRLADFRQKRKVCGTTLELVRMVFPTEIYMENMCHHQLIGGR